MNGVLHVRGFAAAVSLAAALLVGAGARATARPRADQQQEPSAEPSCPTVIVTCPDGNPPRLVFNAKVIGGTPVQPVTYEWSVSAGTILSGQGTPSISVERRQSGTVTATVELGGFGARCRLAASCTTPPVDPPVARMLDRYGRMSLREERRRLDNLAVELRNDPTARGYLIAYGKDSARGRRARSYLVKKHRLAPERLVALRGGRDEKTATELYVVPLGARAPAARRRGRVALAP